MNKISDYNQGEFNYTSDFDCLFQSLNIDADLWEKINELKREFLNNNLDPRRSPYMCPEIAESWIRSKAKKVDPFTKKLGKQLKTKDYEYLFQNKKILIDLVSSYIRKFMPLLTASEYLMALTDETGVVLLFAGSEKELASFAKINVGVSTDMSEELIGTTAHSLCIRYRKPVQIIGPYNYCTILQDNISSATPIMNEKNDVIGALVVVQMLAKRNMQNLQAHSLGWVVSMGYAIENLLKVKKRNLSLALTNGILETTLSLVDEGIITLNKEGYINHINQEGATILGIPRSEIVNRHYSFFMTSEQSLLIEDLLAGGNPVYDFETIIANKSTERRLLMNIRPVVDPEDNNPKGAVIRFLQTEKVDKLVVHRGGCRATYTFENILGKSTAMVKAIQLGQRVGGKAINVLLAGESGTGKELFAQAIHNQFRPAGPFVAINCASMPRNLIESELFGYEGGAFTGAERKGRPGKIELSNNGTLFLDEIGDMPLEIQPVLLRVLEDKKVMRIGGNRYIPVDFRVIAATNKDLYQMVLEKSFREDLYYRLSAFSIKIPPLRERGDDIILLARYFIKDISRKLNYKVPQLSPEAEKRITKYSWPGNVRQLLNAMVYAVNIVPGSRITINDLPDEVLVDNTIHISAKKTLHLEELEKAAILETMKLTNNNTVEAACLLGIGRTTIYRKLKKYGISC